MPALFAHDPQAQEHVMDTQHWEFFDRAFGGGLDWDLPTTPFYIGSHPFRITKFMILEVVVAALLLIIFIPLARKARNGALPRGRWWNAFESLLTFVRNEIARPTLGEHHPEEADRFVPFLWTLFLFILFCNLLGMFPFLGSPTASIYVTGGLALIAFAMLHGPAIAKQGPISYFVALWPHIDVPYVGWLFSGAIFAIELVGTVIKSGVLAVRLFANLFAGHMVLALILLFIYQVGKGSSNLFLWGGVTLASVVGVVALSLLEIFVAFLQAYVFTFLTALFMGMALHPEH
jgi:F-type H+-transporting ATPase subunit a